MATHNPDIQSGLSDLFKSVTGTFGGKDREVREKQTPAQEKALQEYPSNPEHLRVQNIIDVTPVDDGITKLAVEKLMQKEFGGNWGKKRPDTAERMRHHPERSKGFGGWRW